MKESQQSVQTKLVNKNKKTKKVIPPDSIDDLITPLIRLDTKQFIDLTWMIMISLKSTKECIDLVTKTLAVSGWVYKNENTVSYEGKVLNREKFEDSLKKVMMRVPVHLVCKLNNQLTKTKSTERTDGEIDWKLDINIMHALTKVLKPATLVSMIARAYT